VSAPGSARAALAALFSSLLLVSPLNLIILISKARSPFFFLLLRDGHHRAFISLGRQRIPAEFYENHACWKLERRRPAARREAILIFIFSVPKIYSTCAVSQQIWILLAISDETVTQRYDVILDIDSGSISLNKNLHQSAYDPLSERDSCDLKIKRWR